MELLYAKPGYLKKKIFVRFFITLLCVNFFLMCGEGGLKQAYFGIVYKDAIEQVLSLVEGLLLIFYEASDVK